MKILGITYLRFKELLELRGYIDIDWGGDRNTKKLTTGYIFILAGGAVS